MVADIPVLMDVKKNILVGVTGSVATIKIEEVVQSLAVHFPQATIKVVTTEAAKHFIPASMSRQHPNVPILTDAIEWAAWNQRGDPVLHIEVCLC